MMCMYCPYIDEWCYGQWYLVLNEKDKDMMICCMGNPWTEPIKMNMIWKCFMILNEWLDIGIAEWYRMYIVQNDYTMNEYNMHVWMTRMPWYVCINFHDAVTCVYERQGLYEMLQCTWLGIRWTNVICIAWKEKPDTWVQIKVIQKWIIKLDNQ